MRVSPAKFATIAMPAKKKKTRSGTQHKKGRVKASTPLKSLRALVGKKPPFRDEALAPDLDRDLLLALARRELSEAGARLVYRLVFSFKSWNDAYCELLVHEFRATSAQSAHQNDNHRPRDGESRKHRR